MNKYRFFVGMLLGSLLLLTKTGHAQEVLALKSDSSVFIGKYLQIVKDDAGNRSVESIIRAGDYTKEAASIPSFYSTNGVFWLKFRVHNATRNDAFVLNIDYPLLSEVTLFTVRNGAVTGTAEEGFGENIDKKKYKNQHFVFDLGLEPGDTALYILKIKSEVPILLPAKIGSVTQTRQEWVGQDILSGLYAGAILSLFLYNLFIYFSVRDKGYIYYIIYIVFIALTQLTLQGYWWRFVLPGEPQLNKYCIILFPSIAGIAYINFARLFLDTKKQLPRWDRGFSIFTFFYLLAIVLVLAGLYYASYRIIDVNVSILAVYSFIVSVMIVIRKHRAGTLFLISWAMLFIAMLLYVLRNMGVIRDGVFTSNILYLGTALQAILLSIALADRINIYKKEKEQSQATALKVSQENERLIREQNMILEQMVAERTEELQATNEHLNEALTDLKDAQTQLVDAEKMASLGQLTAGIAHEINNPINFVKSNIKPLRLDIQDLFEVIGRYGELAHAKDDAVIREKLQDIEELKQEIDLNLVKAEITRLIEGIEDGAERTAEIVRGLRTFSRLDESELKLVNIHDGIESTLVLLRNSIPHNVKVLKDFGANGNIECYPGKLNQVFMNILNNAVQAIQAKKDPADTEFISILTKDADNGDVEIHIKDSGTGMTEEVKQKIYEPFFTTKDVGEGTGLGMAIVFKIIGTHHGKINIISEPGKGAEFIITLPRTQSPA